MAKETASPKVLLGRVTNGERAGWGNERLQVLLRELGGGVARRQAGTGWGCRPPLNRRREPGEVDLRETFPVHRLHWWCLRASGRPRFSESGCWVTCSSPLKGFSEKTDSLTLPLPKHIPTEWKFQRKHSHQRRLKVRIRDTGEDQENVQKKKKKKQ